jgi:hypothetical protein
MLDVFTLWHTIKKTESLLNYPDVLSQYNSGGAIKNSTKKDEGIKKGTSFEVPFKRKLFELILMFFYYHLNLIFQLHTHQAISPRYVELFLEVGSFQLQKYCLQ